MLKERNAPEKKTKNCQMFTKSDSLMGGFRIFGGNFGLCHKILENNIWWSLDKLKQIWN